jgi:hypothetical protein
MSSPPWKRLVRELSDAGFESPYLGRLQRKLDIDQAHDELEAEIRREMAQALGRAEDKVNAALLELDVIGREIARLAAGRDEDEEWQNRVNARIEVYNRQRDVARRRFWELVIHREALGFRRNGDLREFYPIPPRKRRVSKR